MMPHADIYSCIRGEGKGVGYGGGSKEQDEEEEYVQKQWEEDKEELGGENESLKEPKGEGTDEKTVRGREG